MQQPDRPLDDEHSVRRTRVVLPPGGPASQDAQAAPGGTGWWQRWTEPRSDGLPQVRVLLAFPVLVAAALVVLVATGLSGTSSGVMRSAFYPGPDPALLAFEPQPIRSDEWNVQTVFTISQVQEDYARFNESIPGGVDMSVLWEVPYAEWSTAFRPHNAGFFVLPLDNAFALKWWLPGAALLVAGYMFVVTLWPRRPVAAALLSVAFLASPFFQWWYLPQTLWPPAWALFVMTATVWVQALARARYRWLWAAAVAYLTVTAALGVYVPFLVPSAYVMLCFIAGWVLRGDAGMSLPRRLQRLVPVVAGGAAGGVVLVVYLLTRLETVRGFLGTVYPGQRRSAPGSSLVDDGWETTFLGLFSLGLQGGHSYGVEINSPEAASFLFVGAFVALAAIWLVVRSARRGAVDAPLVTGLALAVVFVAFLYVPGWDGLAHVMFLDRVPWSRLLMGLGLLSLVVIVLVVRSLTQQSARAPWWLALAAAGASLAMHVAFWWRLGMHPEFVAAAGPWPVFAVAFAVAVVAFVRRSPTLGAAVYAVLALVLAGWVNPVYRGVFDVRQTDVARAVLAQEETEPGTWVGVGEGYVGAILTETGVGGFNLLQGAPDQDTWDRLDPTGEFETVWNRLANVYWNVEPGVPRMYSPIGDRIEVRLDSCAPYEQTYVQHVLSDRVIDQPCVELQREVVSGATYYLYRVVPPG